MKYGIAFADDMRELSSETFATKRDARQMLDYLGIPNAFLVRFGAGGKPQRVTREPRIRSIGETGDIATIGYSEAVRVYRGLRDIADTLTPPPPAFGNDPIWYLYHCAGVSDRVYFALVRKLADREAYAEAHRYDRIESEYETAWDSYQTEIAAGRRILAKYANGETLPNGWEDIVYRANDAKPPEVPAHELYNRLWYSGEIHEMADTRETPSVTRDASIGRGKPIRCGAKRLERLAKQAEELEAKRRADSLRIARFIGERHALYCERRAGLSRVHRNPYTPQASQKDRDNADAMAHKMSLAPANSPDIVVRAVARGLACWVSGRPVVATPARDVSPVPLFGNLPTRDVGSLADCAAAQERLLAWRASLGWDMLGRGRYGLE